MVLYPLKSFKSLYWVFTVVLLISCNNNDEAEPEITINDLTGTWEATSVKFTNNSNTSEEFDLISNGGEVRITVLEGGKARTWVTIGTFSDEWDAQLSISGNTIISTPAEEIRDVQSSEFILNGSVLTLTNYNDSFDFTFTDSEEVPATSVWVLMRQ